MKQTLGSKSSLMINYNTKSSQAGIGVLAEVPLPHVPNALVNCPGSGTGLCARPLYFFRCPALSFSFPNYTLQAHVIMVAPRNLVIRIHLQALLFYLEPAQITYYGKTVTIILLLAFCQLTFGHYKSKIITAGRLTIIVDCRKDSCKQQIELEMGKTSS